MAEHLGSVISSSDPVATGSNNKRNRRKRLRLNCAECRQKKLSCDRNLPCQRCVRSGRPELCTYESENGKSIIPRSQSVHLQAQRNRDEIEDLRAEVLKLKGLLAKSQVQTENASNSIQTPLRTFDHTNARLATQPIQLLDQDANAASSTQENPSDPRHRSPRGYYNQHTLFKFFAEIPQLFPFIKESFNEWLKPVGVQLNKNKMDKNAWKSSVPPESGFSLESLLPPKDDTDILVNLYLDRFEQLHRIVHIPTFKKDYASFWMSGPPRHSGTAALVLSMISISACTYITSNGSKSTPSKYRAMAVQWISACDEWIRQQSPKQGKLKQYQISCLVYLAKRMNIIKKKRYWQETGALMQNAVMDNLHRDEGPPAESPYMKEMKRRIWVVIRELDLQNAFEYGLPSLLYNLDSNSATPMNINDENLNETSSELPLSRPPSQYTSTSYQYHSSQTWDLRLGIARRLFNAGPSGTIDFQDVLRYTHEITQAIHSLPSWDIDDVKDGHEQQLPILSYSFLHFQLQECLFTIHRPYLWRENSEFWLSANVCYHIARDVLLMNTKLANSGLQSLTSLREDLFFASLTITRITMLESPRSTSIIMTNSTATLDLMEQCLPFIEEKYLNCFYGEPWCVLTMCASIMLLKIHVGRETWHSAKLYCAQRFLELHYKNIGRQHISLASQQDTESQDMSSQSYAMDPSNTNIMPGENTNKLSGWVLDGEYSDIGSDFFDFDMQFDHNWETWEVT